VISRTRLTSGLGTHSDRPAPRSDQDKIAVSARGVARILSTGRDVSASAVQASAVRMPARREPRLSDEGGRTILDAVLIVPES
jgi:hypothetical protein